MITRKINIDKDKIITKVSLVNYIIPTKIPNTNMRGKIRIGYGTKDKVFIDSREEIEKYPPSMLQAYPTDYALENGANQFTDMFGNNLGTDYWLRSVNRKINDKNRANRIIKYQPPNAYDLLPMLSQPRQANLMYNGENLSMIDGKDYLVPGEPRDNSISTCPVIHLDLSYINENEKLANIQPVYDKNGTLLYHTIEFGKFPQTMAKNSKSLESKYLSNERCNYHNYCNELVYYDGKIKDVPINDLLLHTHEEYHGHYRTIDGDPIDTRYNEFEFCGKRYVRVEKDGDYNPHGHRDTLHEYAWFNVEPIKWIIRNWKDLPRSINPNGTGKAKYLDLRTEKAIITGKTIHGPIWDDDIRDCIYTRYFHYEIKTKIKRKLWESGGLRNYLNNGFLFQAFTANKINVSLLTPQKSQSTLEPTHQIEQNRENTGKKISRKKSRLDMLNPYKPEKSMNRTKNTEHIQ